MPRLADSGDSVDEFDRAFVDRACDDTRITAAGALAFSSRRSSIVRAPPFIFVDLNHVPNAHVGSKVTLIGAQDSQEITVDDWAAWTDSINYEIVSRLPSTLTRV